MRSASHGHEGDTPTSDADFERNDSFASRLRAIGTMSLGIAVATTLAVPAVGFAPQPLVNSDGEAHPSNEPAKALATESDSYREVNLPSQKTVSSKDLVKHLATKKNKYKKHNGCTSIRRRPKEIYMGRACVSQGAKYEVVDGGYPEKGWVYSTVLVSGIYKCGFVRPGVLKQDDLNPAAVAKCEDYYVPLVVNSNDFFDDINCDEQAPGINGCTSGTSKSEVRKPSGVAYLTLYGNVATDKPSPWNIFGTGKGGLSMPLPNKIRDWVSYRAEISKPSLPGRKAIIVKAIYDTDALDWGIIDSTHVPKNPKNRRGGLPTPG